MLRGVPYLSVMARNERIDADALAVLVLPLLATPPEDEPDLRWHRWDEACGAPCGLAEKPNSAHEERPYKRYPTAEWSYFNSHVEKLLFPPPGQKNGDGLGERLVSCPEDLRLGVSNEHPGPELVARIELLERLTIPGPTTCAFGLLHLALEPNGSKDAVLRWAKMIQTPFRYSIPGGVRFVLYRGGAEIEFEGGRPLSELTSLILGQPHAQLDRHLYAAVNAPYPEGLTDFIDQANWRRALGVRASAYTDDSNGHESHSQTAHLGKVTALVRENRASLTQQGQLTKGDARNFRSYWTESLLAGLVQHDALEQFQTELAKLGTPIQPDVVPLYEDWLGFRNRVWWSQLSTSTRVPQELLSRLRSIRGTDRLFTDLEGDLATYSAQQRTIVEGRQARALANLQVVGAGFVVISALLELINLSGADGGLLIFFILVSIGLAAGAGWGVHKRLELDTARSSPGA